MTRFTPRRPTTLGKDSVTPYSALRGDRDDGRFVSQKHLRNASTHHPNTVLTGSNTLYYRDVGVADLPLDLPPEFFLALPRGPLQQR
jgi:hypothetical protein